MRRVLFIVFVTLAINIGASESAAASEILFLGATVSVSWNTRNNPHVLARWARVSDRIARSELCSHRPTSELTDRGDRFVGRHRDTGGDLV
jgi:hypothetical protein